MRRNEAIVDGRWSEGHGAIAEPERSSGTEGDGGGGKSAYL